MVDENIFIKKGGKFFMMTKNVINSSPKILSSFFFIDLNKFCIVLAEGFNYIENF